MSAPRLHRERLRIQTPCSERWEGMQGDDQVRHCGRCDKHVYNLSAMTPEAASALLLRKRFGLCVRYATRPDGTIVSGSCPSLQRRASTAVAVTAAATLLLGASGCDTEPSEPELWPEVEAERVRLDEARKAREAEDQRKEREALASCPQPVRYELPDEPLPPNIDYIMGGPWGHETARPPLKRAGRIARPSLTGQQLAQVVVEGKPALERCCDRRPAASELRKLTLKVRVRARGSVEQVSVDAASEPGFERCVTVSIKRWRFPSANAASEFEFPMVCGPTRS